MNMIHLSQNIFGKFVILLALMISDNRLFAGTDSVLTAKSPLLSLSDESKFSGDQFKSEVTVIQFWASWCTGCAIVMSDMMELLPKYPKVGYINISLDETKEIAMKFFANKSEQTKAAIKYSYLDASGQFFSEGNKIDSLPYLLIINKKGEVLRRIKGHPTKDDLSLIAK